MVFNSIEECASHIKGCMAVASQEMGNKSKQQAQNIIKGQLKGYANRPSPYKFDWQGSTGQTANTPTVLSASSSELVVSLEDIGNWYSVITGEHFFSVYGLEYGTTWNRGQTNIMETWSNWCSGNYDKIFLSSMLGQGVPIS